MKTIVIIVFIDKKYEDTNDKYAINSHNADILCHPILFVDKAR